MTPPARFLPVDPSCPKFSGPSHCPRIPSQASDCPAHSNPWEDRCQQTECMQHAHGGVEAAFLMVRSSQPVLVLSTAIHFLFLLNENHNPSLPMNPVKSPH